MKIYDISQEVFGCQVYPSDPKPEKKELLLEGLRLAEVPEGVYFLNAAPLNLADTDGSPCRAVLIDTER